MKGSSIFYGAIITPVTLETYSALPRALLSVDSSGVIDWVVEDVEPHELQNELARKGQIDSDVFEISEGEFLIPGFIDTHTVCCSSFFHSTSRWMLNAELSQQHAPQFPNMGTQVQNFSKFLVSNTEF